MRRGLVVADASTVVVIEPTLELNFCFSRTRDFFFSSLRFSNSFSALSCSADDESKNCFIKYYYSHKYYINIPQFSFFF
jgi:hypothetical protein